MNPQTFEDRTAKPAIASKSVKGGLLAIAGLAGELLALYSVRGDLPPDVLMPILMTNASILSGAVLAIWGRFKATRPVEGWF